MGDSGQGTSPAGDLMGHHDPLENACSIAGVQVLGVTGAGLGWHGRAHG